MTELEKLAAKATDEYLSDDGRYFRGSTDDLTRCNHGDTGNYSNDADGKLIAVLWNRFNAGTLVEVQCCMCGAKDLSVIEGDGGPECQLDDGRWTCSAECWDKAVHEQIPTGARETFTRTAGGGITIIDKTTAEGGKWALESDPFTEIRVICVDGPVVNKVIAMRPDGQLLFRRADGSSVIFDEDIIPLQTKPREAREVFIAENSTCVWDTLEEAVKVYTVPTEIAKFREVLDDE